MVLHVILITLRYIKINCLIPIKSNANAIFKEGGTNGGTTTDLDESKCKHWRKQAWFGNYCNGQKKDNTASGFFGRDENGNKLTLRQACAKTCGGGNVGKYWDENQSNRGKSCSL